MRSAVCWQRRSLKFIRRFRRLFSRSTRWRNISTSLTHTGHNLTSLRLSFPVSVLTVSPYSCHGDSVCSPVDVVMLCFLPQVSRDSGGERGVWHVFAGRDRQPASKRDSVEYADGRQPAGHVRNYIMKLLLPSLIFHRLKCYLCLICDFSLLTNWWFVLCRNKRFTFRNLKLKLVSPSFSPRSLCYRNIC